MSESERQASEAAETRSVPSHRKQKKEQKEVSMGISVSSEY